MKIVIIHVCFNVSSVAPKLNLIETVLLSTLIEKLDFFNYAHTGFAQACKVLELRAFLKSP